MAAQSWFPVVGVGNVDPGAALLGSGKTPVPDEAAPSLLSFILVGLSAGCSGS